MKLLYILLIVNIFDGGVGLTLYKVKTMDVSFEDIPDMLEGKQKTVLEVDIYMINPKYMDQVSDDILEEVGLRREISVPVLVTFMELLGTATVTHSYYSCLSKDIYKINIQINAENMMLMFFILFLGDLLICKHLILRKAKKAAQLRVLTV